ncbi:hypothetical protein [Schaalia suimastitidis]|uniref:hypothetical protein n=1 Tax=Schaalia suimastitidis TaxID=121163 RepID=UPI00040EE866|nr:hypothetical protein [Schaalia suimastitidis]
MSADVTTPVSLERLSETLTGIGIVPFVAPGNQVAAILPPARVIRFVVQDNRPVHGIAEWHRLLAPWHRKAATQATRTVNATTYLPKLSVADSAAGGLVVRAQHVFMWPVGATDVQLRGEVEQFIRATFAAFSTLEKTFIDPWGPLSPAHDSATLTTPKEQSND